MKFRKPLVKSSILLIALFVGIFLFRNSLLQWSFKRVQIDAHRKYGVRLTATSVRFSGFDCLLFKNLMLRPALTDTLLRVNELECNISLTGLLTGEIGFDEIRATGTDLCIYNLKNRNSLHFISQARGQQLSLASFESYHQRTEKWKEKLFRALSTAVYLKDVYVSYTDSALTENIFLPEFEYNLQHLSALLINQQSGDSFFLSGNVEQKNESFKFSAFHTGSGQAYFPFAGLLKGIKCRFGSVTASISLKDYSDELEITTTLRATDFQLNHWRIANGDVIFPETTFSGICRIGDESVEIDSSSVFTLRQVPFKLFANYFSAPRQGLLLHIHMPEAISDSAFNALPDGMFETVEGISCTGTLAFDLQFSIDTQNPDSLTFIPLLTKKDFRLNHFGKENYARINAPFIYHAYDKGRLVRQFIVGPENPMFTPLGRISHYLPKAVLQSEDPSFMQHRGFLPEAFRESVVQNYKEKRFARGGSTISMQLVKNIFLSRDKTISRKAEEALIVYLIENLALVSKERMFEIYLNIIEWGPNVYGIGEASRFYFSKQPSELNLQESIFLASIIPAPKYFRYRFDKEGNLKPSIDGYFRTLTSRMAGKGWLTLADTIGLMPEVKLKGDARKLIVTGDNSPEEEVSF